MTGLATAVYTHGDIESAFACCVCGVAYVPKTVRQVTCGAETCKAKRHALVRDPLEYALTHRKARRKYAEKTRGDKKFQPWLWGAPVYGTHLPGGALGIHTVRALPIEYVRWLHAVVTGLADEPHDPQQPTFALLAAPTSSGWGVWFRDEATARKLANSAHRVRLGDKHTDLRFTHFARLKAPDYKSVERGKRRVRIDTLTPVSIRHNGRVFGYVERVSASNFVSTLAGTLAPRIGLTVDPESICVELVESKTQQEKIDCGQHFRPIKGWSGYVVLECNAVARWLLTCAERIGLGGRVALGFGRIRCTPLT